MPTISIPALGLQLQADPDENLLKVLRRHRVPIGWSCKRGECGSCKCVLERGEVDLRGYQPGALPAAQREQGIILACSSRILGDVQIGLVDTDDYIEHPIRRLGCRVLWLRELAPEVFALRLGIVGAWEPEPGGEADAGGPFLFSAGQYAHLKARDAHGAWIGRDFSMAGTPVEAEYDGELEFHIRRTPGGSFSGLLGGAIVAGTELRLEGPMGRAYFRPRHQGPLYAVAAGTGLGPMLSVVQTALDNGKTDPVVLYAGFRNPSEVYGVELMRQLAQRHGNFRAHVVVEFDAPGGLRGGRVGDALFADVRDFAEAKVYLAGSPAMVEAVSAELLARGVPARDLHADAFYAPAPEALAPAQQDAAGA
ncbi:2Fe-2S iron-sulfur cluster-binding protein [Thiomonas sp. FB-6]|uniref:2Fe-2S iron-sulfur cluster-binding protein n=1 Tax=Thiomonas sp. FB-6 TaxID=1158291 RepID=UPI00037EB5DB|nr:2Fe-2S iron-sulfur cluster-binding protein [Thiomonas sp. FB-6]